MTETAGRNKRGRPTTRLLTKEKILKACLEIVDAKGLSEFSVVTVADKLGVTGPSIYNYFADRDELLRGLGLLVLREMRDVHRTDTNGGPRPWQSWVRDYADALYVACARHPNVVPILLARRTHGDAAGLFEMALTNLVDGGLDARLGLATLDAVEALIYGWISFDQAREPNWGFGDAPSPDLPLLGEVLSLPDTPQDRLDLLIEALINGINILAIPPRQARA